MKFGTLVVMVMKSNCSNFWVSRTNSISPPPVQKFNIKMVITHYIKTPPITVVAILKSTELSFFATPPSKHVLKW